MRQHVRGKQRGRKPGTRQRLAAVAAALAGALLVSDDAWALYVQPQGVAIADWLMASVLTALVLLTFIRIGFSSGRRRRTAVVALAIALLAWVAMCMFGLDLCFGSASVWDSEIARSICTCALAASSPFPSVWMLVFVLSVLVVSLLSKRPAITVALLSVAVVVYCAVVAALNYREIDGYLADVESTDYQKIVHATAIRNYLSASGVLGLRFYPRSRTKKVLLAALASRSWHARFNAALGLAHLKDPSVAPQLVTAMQERDPDDESDQARIQCAVTLEMLLSNDYRLSVEDRIREEHDTDPEGLFRRLASRASAEHGAPAADEERGDVPFSRLSSWILNPEVVECLLPRVVESNGDVRIEFEVGADGVPTELSMVGYDVGFATCVHRAREKLKAMRIDPSALAELGGSIHSSVEIRCRDDTGASRRWPAQYKPNAPLDLAPPNPEWEESIAPFLVECREDVRLDVCLDEKATIFHRQLHAKPHATTCGDAAFEALSNTRFRPLLRAGIPQRLCTTLLLRCRQEGAPGVSLGSQSP
jgi:hypothetical protein